MIARRSSAADDGAPTPAAAMGRRSLVIGLVALAGGCAGAPRTRFEFREVHMGCDARIVLYANDRAAAVGAARAAFDRIAALDAVLSDWRADSEIERIGAELDRSPLPFTVSMSPLLAESLHCAMCVRRITDDRFDPALGALTHLWRAHRSAGTVPSTRELLEARAASGAERIVVDGWTLVIVSHGLRFDFGGIGKGLAADRALAELGERGAGTALVQIEGDAAIGDAPPGRRGWRVRIAATGEVVELAPGSGISSSGDREQWIDVDGERRSHIVDRTTGVGAVGAPGVTMIVPAIDRMSTCPCGAAAFADGLATAATLMSDAERAELLDRLLEERPGIRMIVTPSTGAPESPPDPRRATRTPGPPAGADRADAGAPAPR